MTAFLQISHWGRSAMFVVYTVMIVAMSCRFCRAVLVAGRLADSLCNYIFPCPCCCILEERHICQEEESICWVLGRQNHPFNGVFCELVCRNNLIPCWGFMITCHLSFPEEDMRPTDPVAWKRGLCLHAANNYCGFVMEKNMFLATTFNRTFCF